MVKVLHCSTMPNWKTRVFIWLKQPFKKFALMTISKTLLQLLRMYFPRAHKLQRIFDQNTEVNYSCMKNLSNLIKGYKRKLILRPCPVNCNMEDKCQINHVVCESKKHNSHKPSTLEKVKRKKEETIL